MRSDGRVYRTLKEDGVFLVNIEHPTFTAGINEDWEYDKNGNPTCGPLIIIFIRESVRLTLANDAAGQGGEIKAGSDTGGVMRYSIRQMKTSEYPLLAEFLYEAIFEEKEESWSNNIIEKPELQVYIKDFGSDKDDHCFLAQADGSSRRRLGKECKRVRKH